MCFMIVFYMFNQNHCNTIVFCYVHPKQNHCRTVFDVDPKQNHCETLFSCDLNETNVKPKLSREALTKTIVKPILVLYWP